VNDHLALREPAERAAASLPPLLAHAEQLAGTLILGEHGRRRAGRGDDFWQYRLAGAGDSSRMIDHRRSARGDQQFVREREWQTAQSVMLWVDRGASMGFSSAPGLPDKGARARLLALACAILLLRGGERVGLLGPALPPARGRQQIERLTAAFLSETAGDHASPEAVVLPFGGRALLISDFLGPLGALRDMLAQAVGRRMQGILLQVLDPAEEDFPYRGRTLFQSMAGNLRHETLKAQDLRSRYHARLAERRDELDRLARMSGWQVGLHRTDESAQAALLWIWRALGRGAR